MQSLKADTMSLIRRFSLLERNILENLNDKQIDGKVAVNIYLGVVIGNCLPIPPNPLNQVDADYKAMYKPAVLNYIGRINEVYILNIDEVEEIAFDVWHERYKKVHTPCCKFQEALDALINIKENDSVLASKLRALKTVIPPEDSFRLDGEFIEDLKTILKNNSYFE